MAEADTDITPSYVVVELKDSEANTGDDAARVPDSIDEGGDTSDVPAPSSSAEGGDVSDVPAPSASAEGGDVSDVPAPSASAEEIVPAVEWVPFNKEQRGGIPRSALICNLDDTWGHNIAVRIPLRNETNTGDGCYCAGSTTIEELLPQAASVNYNGVVRNSYQFEVLCVDADHCRWLPSPDFHKQRAELDIADGPIEIPPFAVEAGSLDGRMTYVARATYTDPTPGYIAADLESGCQFTATYRPMTSRKFEVLQFSPSINYTDAIAERDLVLSLLPPKMLPGQSYALVDRDWALVWASYVKIDSYMRADNRNYVRGPRPGKIQNYDLQLRRDEAKLDRVDPCFPLPAALRAGLMEGNHYIYLYKPAYDVLKKIYGSDIDFVRDVGLNRSVANQPLLHHTVFCKPDGTPDIDSLFELRLRPEFDFKQLAKFFRDLDVNKEGEISAQLATYKEDESSDDDSDSAFPNAQNLDDLADLVGADTSAEGVAESLSSGAKAAKAPRANVWDSIRFWWMEVPTFKVPVVTLDEDSGLDSPAGPEEGKAEEDKTEEDKSDSPEPAGPWKRAWPAGGKWWPFGARTRDMKVGRFFAFRSNPELIGNAHDTPVYYCLMVEKRDPVTGLWPRGEIEDKSFADLKVGDTVDAQDKKGEWYEATIQQFRSSTDDDTVDEAHVHFHGWTSRCDEWVPPAQIAPRGTHTYGYHVKEKVAPVVNTSSSYVSSSSYSYRDYYSSTAGTPVVPGAVGLLNLGNTCFMNSSLACLSHTMRITDHFRSGAWQKDLNRTSALGWKGECAEAYAELMNEYWSGQFRVVAPKNFKAIVGKYKDRFSGYQQQDSSELLNEVLDGLHEDLNQIVNKVMTDKVEGLGRPDSVVAAEAWAVDEKRNKSFIRDECMGQLRSHVSCPECSKESVTFDNSLTLTLQLPPQRDADQTVCLVLAAGDLNVDDNIATKYSVQVDKQEGIMSLKQAVAAFVPGLAPSSLVVGDVFYGRIYSVLTDDKCNSSIQPRDTIYAYQIPADAFVKSAFHPAQEAPMQRDNSPRSDDDAARPDEVADPFAADPIAATQGEADVMTEEEEDVTVMQARRSPEPEVAMPLPGPAHEDALAAVVPAGGDVGEPRDEMLRSGDWHPAVVFNIDHVGMNGKAFGAPVVIPIYFRGEPATRRQIHHAIFKAVRPFMKPSAYENGRMPYTVHAMNKGGRNCYFHPSYLAGCEGCVLPYDDEPLLPRLESYAVGQALVDISFCLVWQNQDEDYIFERANWDKHPFFQNPDAPHEKEVGEKAIDLSDCFDAFTHKEQLSVDDPWYCNVCKVHRQAFKEFSLWRLPNTLIICLKRFTYNSYSRDKIESLVTFPLTGLSLKPWTKNLDHQDYVYDLYGVSNHSGGMGGGHYTAYVRNHTDNRWYMHDDSSVYAVDASQVVSPQAYVLFYERRQAGGAPVAVSQSAFDDSAAAAGGGGVSAAAAPDSDFEPDFEAAAASGSI